MDSHYFYDYQNRQLYSPWTTPEGLDRLVAFGNIETDSILPIGAKPIEFKLFGEWLRRSGYTLGGS